MSNTATNAGADLGMESIRNFLNDIRASRDDIIANTTGIERIMETGLSQILEADRLKDLKEFFHNLFEEFIEQPEFWSPDSLDTIIGNMKEMFQQTFGEVPSPDLDMKQVLQLLKKILPENLGDIDTTEIRKKIDPLLDTLSDLDFRFLNDNPALTAMLGNPAGAQSGKTAIRDRGNSSPQTGAQEGKLDQLLGSFFTSPTVTNALSGLPDKFDKAINKSGIVLGLEDQLLALRDVLTSPDQPLNFDLLMSALADMAKAIGPAAKTLVAEIVQIILDTIKSIYEAISAIGTDISNEISTLLDMLDLGMTEPPGIFTLPATLIAIPLTLVRKIAGKTGPMDFPPKIALANDVYDFFTDRWIYAGSQVADGLSALAFGIAENRNKDLEEKKYYIVLKGFTEISINTIGQLTNVPEKYHRTTNPEEEPQNRWILETSMWWYQWVFGVIWPFLNMALSLSLNKDRSKKWEFVDASVKSVIGMANLVLALVMVIKDQNDTEPKSDKRLEVASVLDAVPGLIDAVCSLITMGTEPFSNPLNQSEAIIETTVSILEVEKGEETIMHSALNTIIKNPFLDSTAVTQADISAHFDPTTVNFFSRLVLFNKEVYVLKSADDDYPEVLKGCQDLQKQYQAEWGGLKEMADKVLGAKLIGEFTDADSVAVITSKKTIRDAIDKIEKKLDSIESGMKKLMLINNKKTTRKKKEDNKILTYLPIISSVLCKGTCATLNFMAAANPAPEIESIKTDPADSAKLIVTMKSIKGEFNTAVNIVWEKKEDGKWKPLDNSNADKKTITLKSEELTQSIRVKCKYTFGYATREYTHTA